MSEIEKKLYEIVANQQKIITALVKQAQAAAPNPAVPHTNEVTHGLGGAQKDPTSGHNAPAQNLRPNAPVHQDYNHDAMAILAALPPLVKQAVKDIRVTPSRDPQFTAVVNVMFHPGRDSDAAFNAVQRVVTLLQQQNKLSGKSYQVIA